MLPLVLLSISQLTLVNAQGTSGVVNCRASDLDWYIDKVGETPCRTYERLRQICDSAYRVRPFTARQNEPGDHCDTQVSSCCCNSVSFALSMLCLNCQFNNNSANGIDAGAGTYEKYLEPKPNGCVGVNQALPADIQTATCNRELKIFDGLYGLFWVTGDWFYTFTRQTLEKDFNTNGDRTFRCLANATSSITTSSSASSSTSPLASLSTTPKPTSSPSNGENDTSGAALSGGAIAGISFGAVVGVGALLFALLLYWRRQKKRRNQVIWSNPDPKLSSGTLGRIEPFTDSVPSMAMATGSASAGPTSHHTVSVSDMSFAPAAIPMQRPQPERALSPNRPGHIPQQPSFSSSGGQFPTSTSAPTTHQGRPIGHTPQQPSSSSLNTLRSHPRSPPTSIPERHEDAGPIRLPPVYDESWNASRST